MLWGIENFKCIMEFEKKCELEYGVKLKNNIQTNGFLITDEWISLFKEYDFSVGISFDGPPEMNGHYGELGNEKSIQVVLNNIKKLKKAGISHGILSVITSKHMGKEKEFYQFWKKNEISNLGLRYCYNPSGAETVDPILLGDFLIKLFELYFTGSSNPVLHIREFEDAIMKIVKKECRSCANACRERCGYFLTIDSSGNVDFCDEFERVADSAVGNLNVDNMQQILMGDKYQKMRERSKEIIRARCSRCSTYDICGAGCRRNDSLNNDENYFCETYKRIFEHMRKVLDGFENLKELNL